MLISECMYAHVNGQVRIGQKLKTTLKGKSGDYLLYEVLGLKNS